MIWSVRVEVQISVCIMHRGSEKELSAMPQYSEHVVKVRLGEMVCCCNFHLMIQASSLPASRFEALRTRVDRGRWWQLGADRGP